MTKEDIEKYYSYGNPFKPNEKQLSFYFTKAPVSLFKYKSDSDYSISSLLNNQLWLSRPNEFNDPFECRYDFNVNNKLKLLMEQRIPESEKVLLTKDDMAELYKKLALLNETTIEERNNTFIACFSELSESILMWSHYSNFHKGFCVEYNFASLITQFQKSIHPVLYGDKVNIFNSKGDFNYEYYKYLLTKSNDWHYEKEWRLIVKKRNVEANGIIIKTPKPNKIIMGCKISCENMKIIKCFCIDNNINLSKMIMHDEKFELIEDKILEFKKKWDFMST